MARHAWVRKTLLLLFGDSAVPVDGPAPAPAAAAPVRIVRWTAYGAEQQGGRGRLRLIAARSAHVGAPQLALRGQTLCARSVRLVSYQAVAAGILSATACRGGHVCHATRRRLQATVTAHGRVLEAAWRHVGTWRQITPSRDAELMIALLTGLAE